MRGDEGQRGQVLSRVAEEAELPPHSPLKMTKNVEGSDLQANKAERCSTESGKDCDTTKNMLLHLPSPKAGGAAKICRQ